MKHIKSIPRKKLNTHLIRCTFCIEPLYTIDTDPNIISPKTFLSELGLIRLYLGGDPLMLESIERQIPSVRPASFRTIASLSKSKVLSAFFSHSRKTTTRILSATNCGKLKTKAEHIIYFEKNTGHREKLSFNILLKVSQIFHL